MRETGFGPLWNPSAEVTRVGALLHGAVIPAVSMTWRLSGQPTASRRTGTARASSILVEVRAALRVGSAHAPGRGSFQTTNRISCSKWRTAVLRGHVKMCILIVKTVFCKYSYINVSAYNSVQIYTDMIYTGVICTTEQNQFKKHLLFRINPAFLDPWKWPPLERENDTQTQYIQGELCPLSYEYYEVKTWNKNRFHFSYCYNSYTGVLIKIGVWPLRQQGRYADLTWKK